MPLLTVRHLTVYRYSAPVALGEHRMMFRPRQSHDLTILRTSLQIFPHPASLRWLNDVFDNSVAVTTFEGHTSELSFESRVTVEHVETALPEHAMGEYAKTYPFRYSDDDFQNLSQGLIHHLASDNLRRWARQFLDPSGVTPTMGLLRSMSAGIRDQFLYARRLEKGVQSPDETLQSRRGSCRDFAVLMMEAVRSLGLAARFVSGYIFTPGNTVGRDSGHTGGGSTHAWMQVYLPGAGWTDFDPTNSIVGNRNLIRVAVARSPEQALPLWGTFLGDASAFLGMDVAVSVCDGGIEADVAAAAIS